MLCRYQTAIDTAWKACVRESVPRVRISPNPFAPSGVVVYRLRPEPFYLGFAFIALGLALSLFLVRDTTAHVGHETDTSPSSTSGARQMTTREIFGRASWRDPGLLAANQAGLVNNLNDGLAWGLFPLFFAASGPTVREIGVLAFIYPATRGVAQLWTGAMSDRVGRKPMIVAGMVLHGVALIGDSGPPSARARRAYRLSPSLGAPALAHAGHRDRSLCHRPSGQAALSHQRARRSMRPSTWRARRARARGT